MRGSKSRTQVVIFTNLDLDPSKDYRWSTCLSLVAVDLSASAVRDVSIADTMSVVGNRCNRDSPACKFPSTLKIKLKL